MKKLNQKGMGHLVVILFIVAFAAIASFALMRTFAAKGGGGKNGGGTTTTQDSTLYTYNAADMYGDGLGEVVLSSEGKGKNQIKFQEFLKGSKASLVNNTYNSDLATPLNDWTNLNKGKQAKFCVTARAPEATSDINFSVNNLTSDGTNTAAATRLVINPSADYTTYCSSPSTVYNAPAGNTVFTINMKSTDDGQVTTNSGPLRIKSAHWQIVQ